MTDLMDDVTLGFFIHNFHNSSFDLILHTPSGYLASRGVDSANLAIFEDSTHYFQGVVDV